MLAPLGGVLVLAAVAGCGSANDNPAFTAPPPGSGAPGASTAAAGAGDRAHPLLVPCSGTLTLAVGTVARLTGCPPGASVEASGPPGAVRVLSGVTVAGRAAGEARLLVVTRPRCVPGQACSQLVAVVGRLVVDVTP